jgi:predicted permease
MASSSGLLSSFLAAIQASLSVLLVISYGSLSAHFSLLDSRTAKKISKICVKLFLPLLLLVQIGSHLHPGSAHRYVIILIWAIICHVISFGVGVAAHLGLGMQDWITAAIMFNNTTSYPLLLVQSLDQTGILGGLIVGDEGTRAAIERAKSYFLVFATVSSCLTFAVGPRLMDSEHAVEDPAEDKSLGEESSEEDSNETDVEAGSSEQPPHEGSRLLSSDHPNAVHPRRGRHGSVISITFFPSPPKYAPDTRRAFHIPRPRWKKLSPRTQWWLLFFYDFLNAPLLGAVLGAFIGFTKPLHRAFFADTYSGGIFTAWLTESFKNVGGLFVPLPLIVAGVSLYTSYQESKRESLELHSEASNDGNVRTRGSSNASSTLPVSTTLFILLTRFVLWPLLSISVIYALTTSPKTAHLLGDDPMLWFAMMLMPTGPPAMKLITMVQVSDSGVDDERKIAKILTVSYVVSPVLAVTVVGALRACRNAMGD